ncbi:Protein toll [Eumeta japonica]|uniref:Protein toll n=1 Tax=Eumeta variegata TaxID=151549 RepID=A0A4C2AEC4_EUMVA|nr:Protein toll [Eumeta japonica]
MNALQNLYLASQKLETLPDELFHDQHDLRRLDLSSNRIMRLGPNTFIGLGRLTHLSLDDNLLVDLERLQARAWSNRCTSRRTLVIANSLLIADVRIGLLVVRAGGTYESAVISGVFSGLNAIEELSAVHNRLEHIAPDAFQGAGATQLRRLRLAHNQLTLTEGSIEAASPLRALMGLQRLELAHNHLEFIYDDWRFGMLQLSFLDLSHNRFTSLTDLDVNFLTRKIDIDLRHNNISKFNFSPANIYSSEGADDPSDVTVWLDDNPLRCDCNIYAAMLRASSSNSRLRFIWGQARCAAPSMMQGFFLANLTIDSFICELETCPVAKCMCYARPTHRVLEVQCTGVDDLPHLDPAVIGRQWRLEHTELLLNGSSINRLGPQDPAPDVTVLDLSNNQLSRLDAADVRRLLSPHRKLWLAGNPIKCDCENEPLLMSLREHRHQVQDYELLRCSDDGEFIQDLPAGGVCLGSTIPIAAALALLAALMAALVLLYRRFESEVKVWLYARGLCLPCFTEEELDRDKRYDAFVSFSHLDESFVVGELVPTLETGPNPLRLCVHVRDWPAGEWIPAQIARSVEQSCRTIVVLSSNFLESVWGRVEFRAAHAAALREGRARVIVVLYGESLDARQLDPELRAYLATNTYIKWGDPYFWHKLRLELPHRRSRSRMVECTPPLTDLVAARKAGFQDGLELSPAPTAPVL